MFWLLRRSSFKCYLPSPAKFRRPAVRLFHRRMCGKVRFHAWAQSRQAAPDYAPLQAGAG